MISYVTCIQKYITLRDVINLYDIKKSTNRVESKLIGKSDLHIQLILGGIEIVHNWYFSFFQDAMFVLSLDI